MAERHSLDEVSEGMDYTTLGRTGLRVSVMGMGCGGPSRLGLSTGRSEADAVTVVRAALDLGINFIDTAEGYGTESIVGQALAGGIRAQVVLSTKAEVNWKGRRASGAEMKARLEACLRRLQTDYVDVFHLHGVSLKDYRYAREELVPAVLDLKAEGKARFVGITEPFGPDPSHSMLIRAVEDPCWDVIMVGFNILNQSARDRVLARTRGKGIGMLCMFAVRRALSDPKILKALMADLAEKGLVEQGSFNPSEPLGFLLAEGVAESVPDAAYRFCRWEPGLDVILSGTSSIEHLRANAASLHRPPLPPAIVARLTRMFARVDSVSGN